MLDKLVQPVARYTTLHADIQHCCDIVYEGQQLLAV